MNQLYKDRSKKVWFKSLLKSLFIADSLKRMSAQNELRDYSSMLAEQDQKLWELHVSLEDIRNDIKLNYKSYDYGNGYYYQSMESLHISGYRNTKERVEQLALRDRLKGKSVLDIGSNTGFILFTIADCLKKGVGVEINPYLVQMGKEIQGYLGVNNVDLLTSFFEDYNLRKETFDVILSLANHSTYDGNTKQSIDTYFHKISDLLKINGELIFESHPPEIEPSEKLELTLSTIGKYLNIEERPSVNMAGFLDRNRTYVVSPEKPIRY